MARSFGYFGYSEWTVGLIAETSWGQRSRTVVAIVIAHVLMVFDLSVLMEVSLGQGSARLTGSKQSEWSLEHLYQVFVWLMLKWWLRL